MSKLQLNRYWKICHITSLLVIGLVLIGLATSCRGAPSPSNSTTSSPISSPLVSSTSTYPADISGHVTITQKIVTGNVEAAPIPVDQVWWVVEILVNNKKYQQPVTNALDISNPFPKGVTPSTLWVIVYKEKVWSGTIFASTLVSISKGETGKMFRAFPSPDINPSDAQICYQGQEPYSYGKLTNGNRILSYDWTNKTVAQASASPKKTPMEVATVKNIWVGFFGHDFIAAELKPNKNAKANTEYIADLYEKGKFRATTMVQWNQPQINVSSTITVNYPATGEEFYAYQGEDVSKIFSVKVHD
jgi:hypothetical protein